MVFQLQPTQSNVSVRKAYKPVPTGAIQRRGAGGQRAATGGKCEQCSGHQRILQRQLSIGGSNEPSEKEADRIAERVMSSPSYSGSDHSQPPIRPFTGWQRESVNTVPDSVNRAVAGAGKPLELLLRQDMEQRFGRDFSKIRLHTGGAAEKAARDINAEAFTLGNAIVFGTGQFSPDSYRGKQLLAHELTHVVQQDSTPTVSAVQRFESPEHQDFGDKGLKELAAFLSTPEGKQWLERYKIDPDAVAKLSQDPFLSGKKIRVGNLQLSPGDVIALMGDFYRSPEALMKAPPEEVASLLKAIKRERAGELGGGKANELYQDITAKYRLQADTYLELAKVNKPHFSPGNREAWLKLHHDAITKARESVTRPEAMQEALLIDAGGGHFLTDAFASGHLFNKLELEVRIIGYIRTHPPRPANPEMQGYFALSDALGVMPQLVLKNIHDRLNTEGVEVRNRKGMKWRTFGDDRLKNAQETLRIGALAIYLSRRQILSAGQPGAADPDPNEVLDLLPDNQSMAQVTAKAIGYIPAAANDVAGLLYRQRGSVKAGLASTLPPVIGPLVGGIIKSNIETIGNPAREKQLLEYQERAKTYGPSVAPQFTVFSL
ncbi:MAG: eCIS core domain-containing protein [Gammaproteobacteria bacterium]